MGGGRRGGKRLKAKMKKSIKNSYIDRHILSVSVSLKTQNRNPYYISKESGRFKNKIPKQSNLRQKKNFKSKYTIVLLLHWLSTDRHGTYT